MLEETVIRTFSRARARSIGQIGHFSMFVFVSVEKDFFRARRLLASARKAQFLSLAHVAMAFPWILTKVMRRQTDAIANAIANRSEGNVEYLSLILVTAFTTLDLLYSLYQSNHRSR